VSNRPDPIPPSDGEGKTPFSSTRIAPMIKSGPMIFRSLRHPRFRAYFFGHAFSLVGTWAHQVAQAWLVYRLTGSAAMLGVVAACQQFPGLFIGPFAGAAADRYPKRRLLVGTQAAAALTALILAALTLSGNIQPWQIVLVALLHGVIHGIDIPSRQAFFVEMVGRDDLSNAIALNSTIVNAARLIGPAAAGIAIAAVGEGWCFVANALSYVPLILLLAAMRDPVRSDLPLPGLHRSLLEDIRVAAVYVRGRSEIARLLGIHALCAFAGMPYQVILAAHVKRNLGGDAESLGLLMAAAGGGCLLGALAVASRTRTAGMGRWVAYGTGLFGAALASLAFLRGIPASAAVLVAGGAGCIVQAASTNTLLQMLSPDHLRGRIVSFYTAIYMGMLPLGGLLAGRASDAWGEPLVLGSGGCALVAGAIAFGTVSAARGESGSGRLLPDIADEPD
jgi:MFS family permease